MVEPVLRTDTRAQGWSSRRLYINAGELQRDRPERRRQDHLIDFRHVADRPTAGYS